MSTDETYNGWANRETWAAALHLSNDQGLYNLATETVRAARANWAPIPELGDWYDQEGNREAAMRRAAGEAIEELYNAIVEDAFGEGMPHDDVQTVAGMVRDVGSTWRVDWAAVADSFHED